MADTFKRLSNLVKGMGNEWMSRMEADNPAAVVKAAQEGARERYEQATRQLGRLRAQGSSAKTERAQIDKELRELSTQRGALGPDDEVGARLDDAILRLEARLETLQTEEVERADLTTELEGHIQGLQRAGAELRTEADSLVTRSLMAQEVSAQQSAAAGAPNRAFEKALNSVRQAADQARRAADTGAPSDTELHRLKAEARLAALKKDRDSKAAPPAVAEPAPSDTAGEEPAAPTPVPTRDL